MNSKALALVLFGSLTLSCGTTQQPLLTGGHSSSGPAPTFLHFVFHTSGHVSLTTQDGAIHNASLTAPELRELQSVLASEGWRQGLAFVQSKGARWACCDRETIFLGGGAGEPLEIPLVDITVTPKPGGPPLVTESPGIPPSLVPGLTVIDRIMREHFHGLWSGRGFPTGGSA